MLALAVVTLLAVVALAARGGHPTGHGRSSERQVPNAVQDDLMTLIAVVDIITIVALVALAVRYRHQWQARRSHWIRNFVTILVVLAILVPVGYRAIVNRGLRLGAQDAQSSEQVGANPSRPSPAPPLKHVPARTAHFNWTLALTIGGLLLAGALVLVLRRGPPPRVHEGRPVEDELSAVVEASIDDLRRERDPRRAVIAAYANMERVLASRGLARHRPETPFEYLARVLRDLHVRESAVRSLTELFEYAKFSTHDIDATMKEDAIDALAAVRADLRSEQAVAA